MMIRLLIRSLFGVKTLTICGFMLVILFAVAQKEWLSVVTVVVTYFIFVSLIFVENILKGIRGRK